MILLKSGLSPIEPKKFSVSSPMRGLFPSFLGNDEHSGDLTLELYLWVELLEDSVSMETGLGIGLEGGALRSLFLGLLSFSCNKDDSGSDSFINLELMGLQEEDIDVSVSPAISSISNSVSSDEGNGLTEEDDTELSHNDVESCSVFDLGATSGVLLPITL